MHVVMIGTGYVGLVTGTCLAEVGHNVTCVDLDANKIAMLKDGKSPIFEPGLDALIRRNIEHERLNFTTDLQSCLSNTPVIFIAVGTPEGEDGSADLGHVENVARQIGQNISNDALVIVKSTVPVGTCDRVEEIIQDTLKKRSVNYKVAVASNPEFLKEGDAITDFMKPDRIVVGLNQRIGEKEVFKLYQPFIIDDPGKLLIMDRYSSELTKYGANAMLATRISFMNELAKLCDKVGANVDNVRRGMGSDPRIGKKFLYAGPGYGGSCFPKDVAALIRTSQKLDSSFEVLEAVSRANSAQKSYATNKVLRHFPDIKAKKICVWGLAFKPGTDDVRESPAYTVVKTLLDAGATVIAHDPQAEANFRKLFGEHTKLQYCKSAYDATKDVDALVLVTEWSEYKRPNWEKLGEGMKQKTIFDFRNQYDAETLMKLGFHYECIGRPDSFVPIK